VAKNTIAVVDDHPIFLDGLASILAARSDFELLAKGNCADDAVAVTERYHPDVLVMDLGLPGNALEAIQKVRSSSTATRVVVFTASTNVDHAVRAFECGYPREYVQDLVAKRCVSSRCEGRCREVWHMMQRATPHGERDR
jgi:DNA-binding NarL/FixJ family response regulator